MKAIKNVDLSGQIFGRLKVLEVAGKDRRGATRWKCLCDCGEITETPITDRLKNGMTRSCGCLQIESIRNRNLLAPGEAAGNDLFHAYRWEAKDRGIDFELTKEQFLLLTKGLCFYCGCEPKQLKAPKSANGAYLHNGVDRLDSSKGYTTENCVPACKVHNFMKLEMSVEEFISACRSVVNHLDREIRDQG